MNSSLNDFKLKIDDAYVNKMPQIDNYGVIRFSDLKKLRENKDVEKIEKIKNDDDNVKLAQLDPFPNEPIEKPEQKISLLDDSEIDKFLKEVENIDIKKLNVSSNPRNKPSFRLFK